MLGLPSIATLNVMEDCWPAGWRSMVAVRDDWTVRVHRAEVPDAEAASPLTVFVHTSRVVITSSAAKPEVSKVLPVWPAMTSPFRSQTVARVGVGIPVAVPAVRVRMLPTVGLPVMAEGVWTDGASWATAPVVANLGWLGDAALPH